MIQVRAEIWQAEAAAAEAAAAAQRVTSLAAAASNNSALPEGVVALESLVASAREGGARAAALHAGAEQAPRSPATARTQPCSLRTQPCNLRTQGCNPM